MLVLLLCGIHCNFYLRNFCVYCSIVHVDGCCLFYISDNISDKTDKLCLFLFDAILPPKCTQQQNWQGKKSPG